MDCYCHSRIINKFSHFAEICFFFNGTWTSAFHWPPNSLCVPVLRDNSRCSGARFEGKITNHARRTGPALQWILQKGKVRRTFMQIYTHLFADLDLCRIELCTCRVSCVPGPTDHVTSVFWYHNTHCLLSQDDLNDKLRAKIKELEDDGAKLQKTVNIQKVQIEKHRASADESSRNCDALRLEVCALKKVRNDKNNWFSMGLCKNLTLELLGCAGARRSE